MSEGGDHSPTDIAQRASRAVFSAAWGWIKKADQYLRDKQAAANRPPPQGAPPREPPAAARPAPPPAPRDDRPLRERALAYHEKPIPGKLSVTPTKPAGSSADLALAYSPGVASPCLEIERDPACARRYTNKGNLVAVITDGSAVLGLGRIGALAAKPVMEGKAMLFKKFAGIDVFDIEVAAPTTEAFIETVVNISPTFGAINLEDIKSPECFLVEERLRERLDIPVFHDDQHGTAVVTCAALVNALELQNKKAAGIKLVAVGAGAASIATVKLAMRFFGLKKNQITLLDSRGVISMNRGDLPAHKMAFARDTDNTTLEQVARGADVIIGVSKGERISPEIVKQMAARPIIFALANPVPEIMPAVAHAARADVLLATGRSDFPNQVNNSICFPYLFRAALDSGARAITEAMLFAAIESIAALAREPIAEEVRLSDNTGDLAFGPDYILPRQFDPRLRERVVPAVAYAARRERLLAKRAARRRARRAAEEH